VSLLRVLRRFPSRSDTTLSRPVVESFPHPYRGAVAISNDCEFMSWPDYLAMYRQLNAPDGLGLEVGTSLFFFVTNALCHSSFGYFQDLSGTPAPEAPLIREMVQAGYIDTIHAYGDFDAGGFTRRHAQRVVDECERHGLSFPLWTNHGSDQNAQNLGHRALSVYQQGDDPDSPAYHLDLLRQIGATFFWVDDGYQQAVAEGTSLLYYQTARDGSTLRLVRRYRGLIGKAAPMAGSLSEQMTIHDLDLLVERGEACIYYQHLGAWARTGPTEFVANRSPYFDTGGLRVLQHLAGLYQRGDCLVTTPARLLRYVSMRDSIELECAPESIVVRSGSHVLSAGSLEGLTISSARPVRNVSWEDAAGRRHPLDNVRIFERGRDAVTITVPWSRLPGFVW
jgi:hypothetical protein